MRRKSTLQERWRFWFILTWFLVMLGGTAPLLSRGLYLSSYFLGLDLEEKKRQVDGELYGAVRVCERKIPPGEPLFFYNLSHPLGEDDLTPRAKMQQIYEQQKISYLLYPRRVYWEMRSIREPVHYVLVYHAQMEHPAFEHWVELSKTIYLLKRKRKE